MAGSFAQLYASVGMPTGFALIVIVVPPITVVLWAAASRKKRLESRAIEEMETKANEGDILIVWQRVKDS